MQCYDGGSGRDGDKADDERVEENEIGEKVSEEIGEELRAHVVEDGSEEQLEDVEDMQCRDGDLDYGDEEGEIVEEKKEVEKEELVVGELGDENDPNRSESSEVSLSLIHI